MAQAQEVFFTQPLLPTSISGCQLWLDVTDPTTTVFLGNVTSMKDKSPNNIPIQISPVKPPYGTNLINGYSGISFGGASWLRGNFPSTYTGTNFIVFTVGSLNAATSTYGRLVSFSVPGQNDYDSSSYVIPMLRQLSGSAIESYRTSPGDLSSIPISFDTNYIFEAEFTGTANNFYVNGGTPATTAISTSFGFSNWGIGYLADYGGTSDAAYWVGNFGECIVYFGSLTTLQRQQMEGYLAWKWGLQDSLPATHPYRTSRPVVPSPNTLPVNQPPLPYNFKQASSFLPTQIPNCQLWLDAADSSTTVLSGTNVIQWNDKSGNGYNAVSPGPGATTNAPSLALNYQNNLNCIAFSPSPGTCLNLPNFTSGPLTVFIVPKYNTATGSGGFALNIQVSGINPTWRIAQDNGITSLGVDYGAATDRYYMNPPVANTNFHVMSLAMPAGTTGRLWVDGAQGINTNPVFTINLNSTIDSPCIGAYYQIPTNASFNGYMCEILWYNAVLNTGQRQQIEGYLAWKWGLQASLPASHPCSIAPVIGYPYRSIPFYGAFNAWQPSIVPNLLVWLDAADTRTITTSGTQVTAWANKGSVVVSANNTGLGAAGICTSGVITQNKNNVVQCPAGAGLSITFASPNQARAWFIVAKNTTQMSVSVPYWGAISQQEGSGQDSVYGPSSYNGGGNTYLMGSGPIGITNCIVTPSAPEPYNVMNLYLWQVSATTTSLNTINVNGTPMVLTTNLLATSYRTDSVAYGINTTSYNTGADICEILFYNGEITVKQRQNIEGYMAWKWGLQGSLPGNHPFKLFPPAP